MNYKTYNMDGYNLYFLKTKKFKTISISIRLKKQKTKEDAVYTSILKEVLKSGSKDYKEINDYYKARLNLYNPSIKIGISNFGNDRTFLINATFADEKYTEKGMNKKTLEFIFNILYNPKIQNEEFDKETFEICRHDYIEMLKSAKDDPFKYASDRLWEEMDVYDFKILNHKEAIKLAKNMTPKDLYNYYQTLFTDNSLDIFVTGDFDDEEMKNIIKNIVKGNFKKGNISKFINYKDIKKEREVIETLKTSQSQIALGLRFKDLTDFERKYVSIFYVSILGGSWSSKLFQTVREENSLCYYIGANRSISHSAFFIYASIDEKNYNQTLKLIKKEIKEMEEGIFTEENINQVIEVYNNTLLEIEDNQTMLMNNLIDIINSNNDALEERRKNIKKVTKQDIINIAKKVNLDVIYFLKGEKTND